MIVNNITEMGMLMSKAASPPIKPPSTQELSELANTKITAAPKINTIAAAAALINTVPFYPTAIQSRTGKYYMNRYNYCGLRECREINPLPVYGTSTSKGPSNVSPHN